MTVLKNGLNQYSALILSQGLLHHSGSSLAYGKRNKILDCLLKDLGEKDLGEKDLGEKILVKKLNRLLRVTCLVLASHALFIVCIVNLKRSPRFFISAILI